MRRYADLVEAAFSDDNGVQIQRVCVARNVRILPSKLRTLAHHASVIRNGRRLAKWHTGDLFHVIDGSHGYLAKILRHRQTVMTVHDVIPKLQCLGRFGVPKPGRLSRRIIDSAVDGLGYAKHLIFDSRSTRQDCNDLGVPLRGNDSIVFPPLERQFSVDEAVPRTEMGRPSTESYLFHIGNNGFYKNREGVINVFSKVAASIPHRLVMAGPPPTAAHQQLARRLGIDDRIDFECDPSDARVRELYRGADALVFPSIYEGFGWPPIEAMAMGCPVVCTDGGSLAEVVGEAAMASAVGDDTTMAANLLQVLSDRSVADRLISAGLGHAKGFGMIAFRSKLERIYRSVVGDGIGMETSASIHYDHRP
ncbi:D-inositol 3-phosphate glycosyltransferase [Stieleria neptunia]|uniref:D-inositol 3-phosphate glycosyltransferase n=2 Tax=Stieleria neptunia TaxID=2527979 RepID=A0A518HQT8_9BACT|nr:D-inositol 3-phosphate glycosyltransferase [Stieleria neptunia]